MRGFFPKRRATSAIVSSDKSGVRADTAGRPCSKSHLKVSRSRSAETWKPSYPPPRSRILARSSDGISQESNHSLMSKVGNPIHRPGSTSTIRKPSGKSPGDGVDGNSAGAGLCFFAAMIFHPFIRVAGQVSRAMEDFPSTPARALGR